MFIPKAMCLFAGLALVGGALIAAGQDPFVGTWKLDLAKSTYSSNHPKPKELTLTMADQGANRVATFNGTAADGSPIQMELTMPIKGGTAGIKGAPPNPSVDTVTLQYVSPTAFDLVASKDGKQVATRHVKMARNHRTFTARYSGPGPKGETITQDDFWRRQ